MPANWWDDPNVKAATPSVLPEDHPATDPGFYENLKSSAGKFVGGIVDAAMSPGHTADTMLNLATGYLNKIGLGSGRGNSPQQEALVQAMNKHLSDRYGSVEKAKHTAYTDPVGFAADLSTVIAPIAGGVGIAGEGAEAAGLVKTASTLGKIAKVGKTVSEVTNPLNAPGAVLKGAGAGARLAGVAPETAAAIESPVSTGATGLAKKLYQQALQPKGTTAEAARKVATGLEEGIAPTDEAGMWNKIMGYQKQVESRINDPRAAELQISPADVAENVKPLLDPAGEPGTSYRRQVTPSADVAKVRAGLQDYIDTHWNPATPGIPGVAANPGTQVFSPEDLAAMKELGISTEDLPAQTVGATPGRAAVPPTPPTPRMYTLPDAQAEKVGTYKLLSQKAFGKSAGAGAAEPIPVASEQTQLQLAKGLRDQIGEKLGSVGISDIHDINRAEGNILDLKPDIERNAARRGNASAFNAKELLKSHLEPQAAFILYKAGKIDLPTFKYILRQGVTGAAQQQDAQPGTQ